MFQTIRRVAADVEKIQDMVADDLLCQRTMRRAKKYKDLIATRHECANVRKPSMNLALSQTKCKIHSVSTY